MPARKIRAERTTGANDAHPGHLCEDRKPDRFWVPPRARRARLYRILPYRASRAQ